MPKLPIEYKSQSNNGKRSCMCRSFILLSEWNVYRSDPHKFLDGTHQSN